VAVALADIGNGQLYGGEMRGKLSFIGFSHSRNVAEESKLHNLELDALRTEMRSIKIQCYNTKKTRVSIVVVLEK